MLYSVFSSSVEIHLCHKCRKFEKKSRLKGRKPRKATRDHACAEAVKRDVKKKKVPHSPERKTLSS